MAKPTALSSEVLTPNVTTPPAATAPRSPKRDGARVPKQELMPLQVRWPKSAVRALKIQAAEESRTVSDILLACFHASKKSS